MKKIYNILLLNFIAISVFGQQDPQFSQNSFNRMSFNPGYAGSSGFLCGNLLGRQQWAGFTGSPQSIAFTADMPIMKETNFPGGVGLTVIADKLGFESTAYVKGAYAYRMQVADGNLGIGLELGMVNKAFSGDFRPIEGGKGSASPDKYIPFDGVSKTKLDLGFGVHYSVPNKYYAGLSFAHLTAPKITVEQTGQGLSYLMARHIYFIAGYDYELEALPIVLKPNVFVKSSFASTQIDLNATALYNNMIWGGVSMRFLGVDAVVPMFGYQGQLLEGKANYRIGYSYDVTLSKLRTASNGSHEIMLGFCYDITPKPKITRYRNVRML